MTEAYYDQLARYYKYFYQDWEASIRHQASILDDLIKEFFGDGAFEILDAACGIGTQSIGLAKLGYHVFASDISQVEIEYAREEATKRSLSIEFAVTDMREIQGKYHRQFDVIIACDNAIPHLLSEADILSTFKQFYDCTYPSGGCMISVRDYANMERGGTKFYPRTVHVLVDTRIVIFDLWQFDGDFYEITTYIVEDSKNSLAKTTVLRGGRYYCVTIAELKKLLKQSGFSRVEILRDRFFQPLIIGVKS